MYHSTFPRVLRGKNNLELFVKLQNIECKTLIHVVYKVVQAPYKLFHC